MISDDALNALKERNPVDQVAGQWVALRARRRGQFVGPCPICSDDPQSRAATRFECDSDSWKCAVCSDGGDVIRLVQRREGVDFKTALERLGGAREEQPTPALARKAGLRAFQAGSPMGDVPAPFNADDALRLAWCNGWSEGKRRDDYAAFARERERKRLWEFWEGTRFWGNGILLEPYFRSRGINAPPNAKLRYHGRMPYFADGREREPLLIHRGPAMLAPIVGPNGHFAGLHTTWLAPDGAGKANIVHPDTGEVLPAKKVRGSKAGGFIELGGCKPAAATRLIAGEGIETVLAVYTALRRTGRDLSSTMFRSAIDLGNLAGRATGTVAHPTIKTAQGRAQRVPGPTADPSSLAMPVPDEIAELVLLGDGDSEPFMTRNALERARARHSRDGRAVRVRFAPEGLDFNDLLQRDRDNAGQ